MITKIPALKFSTLKQITLPAIRAKIDEQHIFVDLTYRVYNNIERGRLSISTNTNALLKTTWEGYIVISKHDAVNVYEFLRQVAINPAIATIAITGSHSGDINVVFRMKTIFNQATESKEVMVVEIRLERLNEQSNTPRVEIAGAASQK